MEGSAAQAGFYYQNNVAALKIIECLFFDSDITHIELENYDKGKHIDDVIIHRKSVVEYYQVKWSSTDDSPYTLYNLLTADTLKKSIFKQLAEGYTSVQNKGKAFSIILYTTRKKSDAKRPSEGVTQGLNEILQKFLTPLLKSSKRYDAIDDYKTYEKTVKLIQKETGLNKDQFDDFLKKLKFSFSQPTIPEVQMAIRHRLNSIGIEESLIDKLLNVVVNWSINGEKITKNNLLQELGINDRFEDKLSHYFKTIDEKHYIPNQSLFDQLTTTLNKLAGGYIFIEGLPGVGKSTALTKFKQDNNETVFAYYCFVPSTESDFGSLRHKSDYFLKSMCIAIERNFAEVDLPAKYSDNYEEKLTGYIDKLGTLGRKVIFVIDGLDHVHRDLEFTDRSLLNQIKGKLPDGVFFILSAQYKAVLSPDVQAVINQEPIRHIKVPTFNSAQVGAYLENKGLKIGELSDNVAQLSGGIPLYLHYISESLIKARESNYVKILNNFPTLKAGEINTYHEYLLQNLQKGSLTIKVLSVLAYSHENIDANTISQILSYTELQGSAEQIQEVLDNFSHLLRQKDGKSYSIFHNSFREFIIGKTPGWKTTFNEALAKYYEAEPYSDQAYRNYFRHLSALGKYEKLTAACTLEWVKTAWKNYRTIEEIMGNVMLALNTAAEAANLSEFIRLVFIKAQMARLEWNISRSDIDFPTLFLKSGLKQNSIRAIWDGDFILVNKPYFAYYLGVYHLKTGELLPVEIIQQGLYSSSKGLKYPDVARIYQARALITKNVIDLFKEIDKITWVSSDDHQTDYRRKNFDDRKNAKNNLKIKLRVVEYLEKHNQYKKLNDLTNAIAANKKLLTRVQLSLIRMLLPSDKPSALGIAKKVNTSDLSKKVIQSTVSFCTDYLNDYELKELFPKAKVKRPELFHKINEDQGSYHIREEVVGLFNQLKAVWVYRPKYINRLKNSLAYYPDPSKSIYQAIFKLSKLWQQNRTSPVEGLKKLDHLKKVISLLYVNRYEAASLVNKGLFDYSNDDNFIQSSIYRLYKVIFDYAVKILEPEQVERLVAHWLDLEIGTSGYRHHKIGLEIALAIYSKYDNQLRGPILKVIRHAEEIARREQETLTLADHLGEVAEVYGSCGFQDEFERLYNQLFEVSFGLGYKKDYQSAYIITALKGLQEIDPKGGLKRLQEVFVIQDQLKGTGRPRMHHIVLSELIEFTTQSYPQLAFELIIKKDPHLWRSEALTIILKPLIKKASITELPLLYSIILTIPRWEGGRSGRENHFLELCELLLARSLELKTEDFTSNLLRDITHHTLVELENEEDLLKFSEILQKENFDPAQYGLTLFKKEVKPAEKKRQFTGDKFKKNSPLSDAQTLIDLLNSDPEGFEREFQRAYNVTLQNRKHSTLRDEYHRVKSSFEDFYDTLPDQDKPDIVVLKRIIRLYLELKQAIVNIDSKKRINPADIETALKEFVIKVDTLISKTGFRDFMNNQFDIDNWIHNTAESINGHQHLLVTNTLSEDDIFKIVEKVALLNVDHLLEFVNKWLEGSTRYTALLKIAHRLKDLDRTKSKSILKEIANSNEDGILSSDDRKNGKLSTEIIETLLQTDPDFGKQYLLKNYLVRKVQYDDHLISDIDELLKYENYFGSKECYYTYYTANLEYNKELATGLSFATDGYDFIAAHQEEKNFPEVTTSYLISLFDYPVIKIREAAIQSLYDLLIHQPAYLKIIFQIDSHQLTDNQLEYYLILCQAIALKKPERLIAFKKQLLGITKREHFNILESAKELLYTIERHYIDQKKSSKETSINKGFINSVKSFSKRVFGTSRSFLNNKEKRKLNRLNKPPKSTQQSSHTPSKGEIWFIPVFPEMLLNLFRESLEDDTEMYNDIYQKVASNNDFSDYGYDDDAEIHRQYNINSNFDTIEIHSLYHEAVESSINHVFFQRIKAGSFDQDSINQIKSGFRLHDPSSLILKPKAKPDFINWIAPDQSEESFLAFKDIETWPADFIRREEDFITLYEQGSERPSTEYGENQRTTHFEVLAFLKKKDSDKTSIESISTPVSIEYENKYTYELPAKPLDPESLSIEGFNPILEINSNNFRGQLGLKYAILTNEAFQNFGIDKRDLLQVIEQEDDFPLKAILWQKAYTPGSERRRYKPTSEGFTLKIKKNVLATYLKENDLVLCYELFLKRSTDKYRPETHMYWEKLKQRFEITL